MKCTKMMLCAAALSFLLLTGCEKGDNGTSGVKGLDGNANIFNKTYPVSSSQWNYGGKYWYIDLPVDELTISTASTAGVMVYWGGGNNWMALPYTHVNTLGNYFMGFVTAVDIVEVRWTYNLAGKGDDPCTELGGNFDFKVVVIPPSVMMKNPNLNVRDYQEVKRVLKLEE
jgi:hypothetical protein